MGAVFIIDDAAGISSAVNLQYGHSSMYCNLKCENSSRKRQFILLNALNVTPHVNFG